MRLLQIMLPYKISNMHILMELLLIPPGVFINVHSVAYTCFPFNKNYNKKLL